MNKFFSIFFVLTAFAGCFFVRSGNTFKKMDELLQAKDYFLLETSLKNNGSQLSDAHKLYFRARTESAFNQTEQSLQTIDLLFSKHKKSFSAVNIFNLLGVKLDNHYRQFEYKQAAETWYVMLDMLESLDDNILGNIDLEALKSNMHGYELLKNVPTQKIFLTTDVIIPFQKNEIGHLIIQVTSNGVTNEFIFDTGSTLSTIKESVANRMGIKPLSGSSGSMHTHSSTGRLVEVKRGVADSLLIGNLLFENVVFNIIIDDQPTPLESNYSSSGTIGFPVMNQMKEFRIDHMMGNIVVPKIPVEQDLHNMFWDGVFPVVRLESGQDILLFILDTGATNSRFFKKYFNKYRENIIEKGQRGVQIRYGLDGSVADEVYILTNVTFKIGDFKMTLPKINVQTQEHSLTEKYDGLLGLDILSHSDEIVLNLESMYLAFKNNNKEVIAITSQ